jgi:hypothetical protein
MNNKALLLNFEGTILRDKQLLARINHHTIKYIQTKIPHKVSYHEACKLNNYINDNFTHPVHGLKAIFNPKLINVSIYDYDEFVYTPLVISEIKEYTTSLTSTFKLDSYDIIKLKDMCDEWNVDIFIISNAPFNWCYPKKKGLKMNELTKYNVISNDMFDITKRSYLDYHQIYNYVELITRKDNPHCIVVDTSFNNLKTLNNDKVWTPVILNEFKNKSNSKKDIHNIKEISHIRELYKLFMV